MNSLCNVFWMSAIYNFRLKAVYYPGKLNTVADSISRLHEKDGYKRLTNALQIVYVLKIVDLSYLEASIDQDVLNYLKKTYAPSAQLTYHTHRDTHLRFCSTMGYNPVPATTTVLCHYASFLSRTLKYTSVGQYMNIVRLLHLELGLQNQLVNSFKIEYVLKGIRRDLGDTPTRKLPIDPSLLLKILSKLDLDNIEDCNVWAAALVMFYGMLRRSNALTCDKTYDPSKHLRRGYIAFHPWGAPKVWPPSLPCK